MDKQTPTQNKSELVMISLTLFVMGSILILSRLNYTKYVSPLTMMLMGIGINTTGLLVLSSLFIKEGEHK